MKTVSDFTQRNTRMSSEDTMHKPLKNVLITTAVLGFCATSAMADPVVKLRIQNHHAPESAYGTKRSAGQAQQQTA